MKTQQPGQGVEDTGCTIKEKQAKGTPDTNAHAAVSQTAARAALNAVRLTPFELICGLGLACNFVWCTLEGHAVGFLTSAHSFYATVNCRIFFQIGLFITALVMFFAPRMLKRHDRVLAWVIPILSAVATVAYARPGTEGPLTPDLPSVIGLTVSGIGYCWLVARFYLMISQRRGFASCVMATILCLIFKELALSFLFTIPSVAQIIIASIMPICMCALCALAARMPVAEKTTESDCLPQGKATKHDTLLYACVLALILSTLRGFSNLGMWGSEFPGVVGPGTSLFAAVLYAVALVVFGLFAVLVPSTWPSPARFRPATLVLLAGLFLITLRSYLGDEAVPYELLQAEELLSHLAFWSAVAALLQGEAEPTLRTTALPIAVYSGASALLVMLMSRTAALSFVFVSIVAYLVFAAITSRGIRDGGAWQTEGLEGTAAIAEAGANGQLSAVTTADEAAPEDALNTAVSLTCDRLIDEYRLSPREAQILPMVIEGRSRAYISEQLNLSDSTVKTHISHIYGKCSVTGRQGLVELVFQAPEEA